MITHAQLLKNLRPDGLEHLVAGVYMDRSIRDFARACGVYLK